MKRRLWTEEKPTTSGYYWLKDAEGNSEVVVVKRGRANSMRGNEGRQLQGIKVEDIEGKWHPVRFPSLADANKHETYLKQLTAAVSKCLEALDAEMKKPESNERGKKVAAIANALDYANQATRMFGLGDDLR
jgi:hypothetical protein